MAKQVFTNEEYGQFLNAIGNDNPASTPVNMRFDNNNYSVMLNVATSAAPNSNNVAIACIENQNGIETFNVVDNTNGHIHQLFVKYLGDMQNMEEDIN